MELEPAAPTRRLLPLLAWVAVLVAALVAAVSLGRDPGLAAPPLGRPGALAGWADAREPVVAAFAVLRLVVVGLAGYLLVVTALAVVLRLGGADRLVRVAEVVTLPWVRGVAHGALGLGLAGSAVASVAAVGGERADGPARWVTATAQADPVDRADVVPGGTDHLVRLPDVAPAAPGLRRLSSPPPAAAPTPPPPAAPDAPDATDPPPDLAPPAAPVPGAQAPALAGELTVGPGDHLWALAEQALGAAWGAEPTEAEVGAYWQVLVDANRDRLADPANPDLVFPGQVLVLVAPPAGR